jgi:hypothetical protein
LPAHTIKKPSLRRIPSQRSCPADAPHANAVPHDTLLTSIKQPSHAALPFTAVSTNALQ